MESQDNPEELAAQAERCRRLAGATYNREVSDILGNMADQYQRAARELLDRGAGEGLPLPRT
jgi:hypothetical protein